MDIKIFKKYLISIWLKHFVNIACCRGRGGGERAREREKGDPVARDAPAINSIAINSGACISCRLQSRRTRSRERGGREEEEEDEEEAETRRGFAVACGSCEPKKEKAERASRGIRSCPLTEKREKGKEKEGGGERRRGRGFVKNSAGAVR